MPKNLDHTGREITAVESPETRIKVWIITPHQLSDYDHAVIRCYQDAVAYAQDRVEQIMDDSDREYPLTVTMDVTEMRLEEYEGIYLGME